MSFVDKMRELMPYFFFESIEGGAEKTVFLNFCGVLFNAFQNTNDALVGLCQFARDRLGFTGQVLSLETFLNNEFDPEQRRILIFCLNNNAAGDIDLFSNGETDPGDEVFFSNMETPITPVTLFSNGERDNPDGSFGKDFEIRVPLEVPQSDAVIASFANLYVIAPQNYGIVRI